MSYLYLYAQTEARYPISPVLSDDFDPALDYSDADIALISFLEAAERFGAALDPTPVEPATFVAYPADDAA